MVLMKKMQPDRTLASQGPTVPLQPRWPLPCLPCEGKEEWQVLEPARVPGPITGTVGCLYNCWRHEDCQRHAGF